MIRASLMTAAVAALLGVVGCQSSNQGSMSRSNDNGARYVATSGGGNGTAQQQWVRVDPAAQQASEQPYALTGRDDDRASGPIVRSHGGNGNWASLPAHN